MTIRERTARTDQANREARRRYEQAYLQLRHKPIQASKSRSAVEETKMLLGGLAAFGALAWLFQWWMK